MKQERVALSQKEIKRIKVMVYNRSDKPSASRRGNDAASRHKRPAQHLRLTAEESWPSAYEPLSEADHQAQEEVTTQGEMGHIHGSRKAPRGGGVGETNLRSSFP